MKKTIGIVSEGPTDYILLRDIIDKITNEENSYIKLQPEDNLRGEYGNGWKAVWKWCLDHGSVLRQYMKEVTPQLDFIVVQMDGDVSRKEKEVHCTCENTVCELRETVHPLECETIKKGKCPIALPCGGHTKDTIGYIEHLTKCIGEWVGIEHINKEVCVAIPCDSTDAWIVAAYDEDENSEKIDDPWKNIISHSKNYHEVRVPRKRKNQVVYRQFVGAVNENWEKVKVLCKGAAIFEEGIKKINK